MNILLKKCSKEFQLFIKKLHLFEKYSTILSGLIPDQLCNTNFFKKNIIYIQYYNIYRKISKKKKKKIIFNNSHYQNQLKQYQQVIYFWTKNKKEIQLQLTYLLSYISMKCIIYIIGRKNHGISSIEKILNKYIKFKKIFYARNCCLYQGYIIQQRKFLFNKFVKINIWNNMIIKSLPGVFGYKKIDQGSKLLISTFNTKITGKVLDIGSGTGILSIALAKKNPHINLTLIDIYEPAIWCSKNNLIINKINGKVFFSDVYSDIKEKYNLIISNPPIHENIKINLKVLNCIIKNIKKYLKKKGELRIVINSSIYYDRIFKQNNLIYKKLIKKNNYTVVQIIN